LGVHSAKSACNLLSTLLCQQHLASYFYRTHLKHNLQVLQVVYLPLFLLNSSWQHVLQPRSCIMFCTRRTWVCILQILQVVYLSLCFVSSTLQHVLLLWSASSFHNTHQTVFCAYAVCLQYATLAAGTKLLSKQVHI